MKFLIPIAVLSTSFFTAFAMREIPSLPQQFSYLPDFVIAAASVVVGFRLLLSGTWARVPIGYVLLFLGFLYATCVGLLINEVEELTVIGGIRTYFKYVPVFLIAFAYPYSSRDLETIGKILVVLVLVQVPVTMWQRFIEFWAYTTGDSIRGTLSTTTSVSLLSSGAVCMVAAYYIHNRASLVTASLLGLLALAPAALAETKATPILIACGGAGLLLAAHRLIPAKRLVLASTAGVMLLVGFVVVYDAFYAERAGRNVPFLEMMTSPEYAFTSYNYKGLRAESLSAADPRLDIVADPVSLTDRDVPVGRIDSVRMPFDSLWPKDPIKLAFGLGLGNVSTTLGDGGYYLIVKEKLNGTLTTVSMLIWETGLIGLLLFLGFLAKTARDALSISSQPGIDGALGAGHFGLTCLAIVSMLYANIFYVSEITVLFMFLAGVIAARRRLTSARFGLNHIKTDEHRRARQVAGSGPTILR